MAADPANYPRRRDLRSGDTGRTPATARPAVAPPTASQAPPRSLTPAEQRAREAAGRHANGTGDGFGRVVGFTILGAIIPGAGLVAAGRKKLGWTIIALLAIAVGGVAALVLSGRALELGVRVGTDPQLLLVLAAAIVAAGLLWWLIIVGSHAALRRGRLTRGQRGLSVLLVAALMGLVALPAATAARYTLVGRSALQAVFTDPGQRDEELANPVVDAPDPWADVPRVNVLILGSDADVLHEGIRPDTIIVASIDTATGDTVLFNLPRQLRGVPFSPGSEGADQYPDGFTCGSTPDSDPCILNAVWQWGTENPDAFPDSDEPGLAATRDVVGQTLGLTIDYDVVVNLDGFSEVVDAMGGLRLNVETRLPIGGGKDLINGGSYPITGYVEAGDDQLLDGYHALWYARSRASSDNNDRMLRQQCTLSAAVQQFDVVGLARAFPTIAASAERNVETDIPTTSIPAFVDLGQRIQGGALRSLPFTSSAINTGALVDASEIQALVQSALFPGPPVVVAPTPSTSASAAPEATPSPSESATVDPTTAQDATAICGPYGS